MESESRRVADYFLCVGLPDHHPQPLEGRWHGAVPTSGGRRDVGSPAGRPSTLSSASPPPSPGVAKTPKEPITDVCVLFPTQEETPPPGFEIILRTPNGLPADLNHGSLLSPEVFLCVRRGRDKAPLSDIGVIYDGKEEAMGGCETIEKTPYGRTANVNNTSSPRIFLTYRRAAPDASPDSLCVTDICVIIKNEPIPHAYCKIDRNLNKGSLMGSDVFLCYRKSLTKDYMILYRPNVLSRYPVKDHPSFPLDEPSVAKFGLPMGAALESWPLGCVHPRPVFSTFVLTGESAVKVYGASVVFYEDYPEGLLTPLQRRALGLPLTTPSTTPGTPTSAPSTTPGTPTSAPSTNPGTPTSPKRVPSTGEELGSKGGVLEGGAVTRQRRTVHVSKAIILLSRWPFFDAFKRFLQFLYKTILQESDSSVPLERYISHFLSAVPFPSIQRPRMVVELAGDTLHLSLPEDSPIPLSGASFSLLLKHLGSEGCVNLMTYALMEHKILVHSLRAVVLTSVIEALGSLLFPFRWQCPYIPLCPIDLADVLCAPCPYIVGVDSRYFDLYEPPADVTWVDLDTCTITQPEEKRHISYKMLPKRPAQVLQKTLDKLLIRCAAEAIRPAASEGGPGEDTLAVNLKQEQRDAALGTAIQEAFLRFTASIMKGYKAYLLPITGQPTDSATSAKVLFNMDGFLRSRGRTYHKFYEMVMRTQLFIRFVEVRTFHSNQDAGLAFFDECVDKVDENLDTPALLGDLQDSNKNERTVFVMPPQPTGLPEGATYNYKRYFPVLNPSLFDQSGPSEGEAPPTVGTAPPGASGPTVQSGAPVSHLGMRTKAEARSSQKEAARAKAGVISLWAKALISSSYGLWFTQLPAFVHYSGSCHGSALKVAYTVIRRMHMFRLHNPDETCYRVFMQLCGLKEEPALAVKLLKEMKQHGVQPDALTYGYYNKALLESKWADETGDLDEGSSTIVGDSVSVDSMPVGTGGTSGGTLVTAGDQDTDGDGLQGIAHDSGEGGKSPRMEGESNNEVPVSDDSKGVKARALRPTRSLGNTPHRPLRPLGPKYQPRLNPAVGSTNKKGPAAGEQLEEGEKFRAKVGSIIRKSVGNLADLGSQFGSSAGLLIPSEGSPYGSGWGLDADTVDLGGSLNITSPAGRRSSGSFSATPEGWGQKRRRHRSASDALHARKVALANRVAAGSRHALSPRATLNSHGGESGEELSTIFAGPEEDTPTARVSSGDQEQDTSPGNCHEDGVFGDEGDGSADPLIGSSGQVTLTSHDLSYESLPFDQGKEKGPPLQRIQELSPLHSIGEGELSTLSGSSVNSTPVTTDDPLGALSVSPASACSPITSPEASPLKVKVSSHIAPSVPTEGESSTPSRAPLPKDSLSIEGLFSDSTLLDASEGDVTLTQAERSPPGSPQLSGFRGRIVPVGGGSGANLPGGTNGKLTKSVSIDSRLSSVSVESEGSGGKEAPPSTGGRKMGYVKGLLGTSFTKKSASAASAASAGAMRFTKGLGSKLMTALSKSKDSIGSAGMGAGDAASFSSRESLSNVGVPPAPQSAGDQTSQPAQRPAKAPSTGRTNRVMPSGSARGDDPATGRGGGALTRTTSAYIGTRLMSATNSVATSLYRRYTEIKHTVSEFQSPSTVAPGTPGGSTKGHGRGHRRTGSGVSAGPESDEHSLRLEYGDDISLASSMEDYMSGRDEKARSTLEMTLSVGSMSSSFIDKYFPFTDTDSVDGPASTTRPCPAQYEVLICSATLCQRCHSVLYEEEIMAGWTAEDSNLNTICAHCDANVVPFLNITVQDTKTKGDPAHSFPQAPVSPRAPLGSLSGSPLPRLGSSSTAPQSPGPGAMETDDFLLGDLDALASPPASPMKKHFSVSREPVAVPYLSALVLRKELDNVLSMEGDNALSHHSFIDEHPILFWNLVWYFKRLGLLSHLPNLIMESCLEVRSPRVTASPTPQSPTSILSGNSAGSAGPAAKVHPGIGQVTITAHWDRPALQEALGRPLYVLWAQEDEPSSTVNALVTDTRGISRGHIGHILTSIECNDISSPLKVLLAERKRILTSAPMLSPGHGGHRPRRRFRSLYRELLFLALAYFGHDLLDHDSFDREFRLAFEKLTSDERTLLQEDDYPPKSAVNWCRKLFANMSLPIPV